MKSKLHYRYSGPIYNGNQVVARDWESFTYAMSEREARVFFNVKAREYMGYKPNAGYIKIDPDKIYTIEVSHDDPFEHIDEPMKCDKCGRLLDDSGTCPYCDQGEEDI